MSVRKYDLRSVGVARKVFLLIFLLLVSCVVTFNFHASLVHSEEAGGAITVGTTSSTDYASSHVGARATKTLRVGVVGPKGTIQWNGLWEGAQLARDEVNSWNAGQGILIGPDNYQIELVDIDSHAYPVLDPAGGVAELEAALTAGDGLAFLIGGFRTECVIPMIEAFCDYCNEQNDTASYPQPVWYIAGAATDSITNNVQSNYDKYRYMFRVAPMNITSLTKTLIAFAAGWTLPHKLIPIYGLPVKTYIVAENLVWCDIMPTLFQYYLNNNTGVYPLCDFVGVARPAWDETDFSAILSDIESKDAHLVFHIWSASGGASFIEQFGESQIPAVCVGVNVESQNATFYDDIGGKCEFETILGPVGTRTPIWESLGWGTATQDFWDDYMLAFGHPPIYTAFGCYDGVLGFAEFLENQTSWPIAYDDYIPILEQTERRSLLGKFKFTSTHDVYVQDFMDTWPEPHWVRPQIFQWQTNPRTGEARLQVVWPRDQAYSKKWSIPKLMYSLAETDWYGALELSPPYNPTIGPDGEVDISDLLGVAFMWQQAPYPILEADMDGNNLINLVDLCRISKDYGASVSLPLSMGIASMQTASLITEITKTNSNNNKTTVYLDRLSINATEADVNENVTINLMIRDAVDIYGWQAGLIFNSSLLECIDFFQGEFLQSGGKSTWWISGSIDNNAGVTTPYSCFLLGDYNASGSGQIAYLKFKVKQPGLSNLHLRDVMVTNASDTYGIYPFNIIDTYTVARSAAQTVFTVSNSTGQEATCGSGFSGHAFSRPDQEISFDVEGPYQGWSNVTVPKALLNVSTLEELLVIIDGVPLKTEERTVTENATHYFAYLKYTQGTHNIRIRIRPLVYNKDRDRYYPKIQEAINAAGLGDEILVYAGTLSEHVVVNKTVSLIGENKHNTTIDGGGTGTVIIVTANNVNISNFTIRNSGNPKWGILLYGSSGNKISHNIITNNYYGIHLVDSSNNTLDGNNANNNDWYGICLDGSDNNTIGGNSLTNNGRGLTLKFSGGNTLRNNNMTNNSWSFAVSGDSISDFDNDIDTSNKVDGKSVHYIANQSNLTIDPSTFPDVGYLGIVNSTNVTVKDLSLTKNGQGILFAFTNDSTIENVNVSKNWVGIQFWESDINTVCSNMISNNSIGIILDFSDNNIIYHNNFIDNELQAGTYESYSNAWDDGYLSGGNYWSDHSITYPFVVDEFKGENQDVQGNDGIIDDPKAIDEENQDNYPLVSPLTPPVYNLNIHLSYITIQGAINSAQSGHMIIVRNGTYPEQVTIDKPLTLIGIIGSTVINGSGTVVNITAGHVTFRGFTIQGSGSTDKGILVDEANNTVISENTITNKGYGIWLHYSYHCNISGNTITNNTLGGIRLEFSGNAIISRNIITNNSRGIVLSYSNDNAIHRNNVTHNSEWGIELRSSDDNIIYHNKFINTNQVYHEESVNTWDDGGLHYLCPNCSSPQPKGNYWSDYTGLDNGEETQAHNCEGDGVGDTDTPHLGLDNYPLMSPLTPQHDVAVVSTTPYKTAIARGFPLSVTVTLENQGDYTEKFNVTAYYNRTAIINPNGKNYTTITVTSENYTIITFTWNTTGVPYGNYTISANATTVSGETYTADNTFEDGWVAVSVPGDCNGDGYVNPTDVNTYMAFAYGSQVGDPNYNPNCDINGDGYVNPTDINTYLAFWYGYPW